MSVEIENNEKSLVAYISGDLDHHTAKNIRTQIDIEIGNKSPKTVALDFSRVTFMDSSGIGLVMGRFKIMQERGGIVVIQNPPPHIKKVMLLAGLNKIAKITTKAGADNEDIK